jgi:hypothetical protein
MLDGLAVGCLGWRGPGQIDFVAFPDGVEVGDRLRKLKGWGQWDSGSSAAVEQGHAKQAEKNGRNCLGG